MNSKVKKLLSFIFVLTMFIGISAYSPDDVQAAGAAPHTLAGLQVNAGRVDAKGKEASLYDSSGNIIKVLDPISSNWENSFKFTDKSLTESVIISRTDFEEINTNGGNLSFREALTEKTMYMEETILDLQLQMQLCMLSQVSLVSIIKNIN